jgi:hypothetical protein
VWGFGATPVATRSRSQIVDVRPFVEIEVQMEALGR